MSATPLKRLRHLARRFLAAARARVTRWARPVPLAVAAGAVADATRSRSALPLENALLRHQLVVLSRSVKRPRLTAADRGLLVLLTSRLRARAGALVIVRPETVPRRRRAEFRLFWRRRSRLRAAPKPKVAGAMIAPIRELAAADRLWGADRIRGELLKLDLRVSKRTIQRYLRQARPSRPRGQAWATFLRTRASEIWACDFLPVNDGFSRPFHTLVIIALGSRRVVHVGVTRHPTDAWVAQQLREATPFDERPRFLIRDNDAKYGPRFDRLAAASGIRVLRTPIRDRGPTPPASASWAACGGSAWTMSSSWARRTCGACSARMSRTSTAPGPTKESDRQSRRDQRLPNDKVETWDTSSPSRSWAVSTTTIAVSPDRSHGLNWRGHAK